MTVALEKMTPGVAVMTLLRAYGVDHAFGIPGTHSLEFYRELNNLGIRPITTRHEQGAGYAAIGFTRRRGTPGVVIATSGPGLLNTLSSVGTAHCESHPLLILSPGSPVGEEAIGKGPLHETKDPVGAMGAIARWSRRAESMEAALESVHDAFASFSGRARPVHIEIPLDVLETAVPVSPELLKARTPPPHPVAADDQLAAAAQALAKAERPVIWAGQGAIPAAKALRELAERLGAPVVTTINGKGVFPESHPLSLRAELRLPSVKKELAAADVVVIVGSKAAEMELWNQPVHIKGTLIRIDVDATQAAIPPPGAEGAKAITLVGDAATVLPQLTAGITQAASERVSAAHARVTDIRAVQAKEAAAISTTLIEVAEAVAKATPPGTVVTGDASQITYYAAASVYRPDAPNEFLHMLTYSTLGYGLPAAIGASLADNAHTLCLVGDGALMFAVQEFATAVQEKVNMTIVVVDNGGYRQIKGNEEERNIKPIAVDLHQPDWPMLARAFGATGVHASSLEELTKEVAAALAAPGVHLVHYAI